MKRDGIWLNKQTEDRLQFEDDGKRGAFKLNYLLGLRLQHSVNETVQ